MTAQTTSIRPALSHEVGSTDIALLEETIDESFRRICDQFADREALVATHQAVRFTYAELDEQIECVARGLLSLGLKRGDRVGLWSPNRFEWVLVQYATARIGVIMVCINPSYRSSELEFVLGHSGCRALIAAPAFKISDYDAIWKEVEAKCPDVEHTIFFGMAGWEELLRAGEAVSANEVSNRQAELNCRQPINIQYTSGTTGQPKGATLTHRNILNNAFFSGETLGFTEADRVCVPLPLYHCFGMVVGSLGATTHGACLVLPSEAFEAKGCLEVVQLEPCTALYGVPTMFIAELAEPDFGQYDLSSLRTGVMGGSPCPAEVMKRVMEEMNMSEVTIAYGMTETSPVSTQTVADDTIAQRVGSVGRVHPHVEIRIVDPETNEVVPRGSDGEFLTRGYSVMDGYWDDPEKTAQAIDSEGWMHTGDLARMDDDGYVQITGRIKDLIIRGGENVSPREIEEFLYEMPDVLDVQVVGVPDERFGEEICACITSKSGDPIATESIRAYCKGQIAHFKIPRYVLSVSEFPLTVTGKIQKYRLREIAVRELGLEVG